MKHSPGPWRTEWRRGYRVFVEHNNGDELDHNLIARVSGPEANAVLIAAAPDLLGALKAAPCTCQYKPPYTHQNKFVCARCIAIAKAQGEIP